MSRIALAAVAGFALSANAFAGPIWTEVPDAGSLPGTSQATGPTGSPLTQINGSTGGGDFEDMFQIFIPNLAAFSATTVSGAAFDTQLWLFNAAGIGVLGNDDSIGLQSTISFPAADGPPPTQTSGMFFIAISGFNNDPVSAGGAIFNQQSFSQVSGPDGVGGASPIIGWTGGGATGAYSIFLTGAGAYVPTPGALGLFGIAGLAATRRRRA